MGEPERLVEDRRPEGTASRPLRSRRRRADRTSMPAAMAACQKITDDSRSAWSSRSANPSGGGGRRLAGRLPLDPDGIAWLHRPLSQHARVHAAVARVRLDRESPEAAADERVPDGAARARRLRDLEDQLGADHQARADRQHRHVEARGREVLAGGPRSDRVALRAQRGDGLDPEDRDGTMRPAVDRVGLLPIALDAVASSPAPRRPEASARHRPRR